MSTVACNIRIARKIKEMEIGMSKIDVIHMYYQCVHLKSIEDGSHFPNEIDVIEIAEHLGVNWQRFFDDVEFDKQTTELYKKCWELSVKLFLKGISRGLSGTIDDIIRRLKDK